MYTYFNMSNFKHFQNKIKKYIYGTRKNKEGKKIDYFKNSNIMLKKGALKCNFKCKIYEIFFLKFYIL